MKMIFKKIIVCIITLEARLVLKKYKPKIVAVTGSVGKTMTKDAICTILARNFYIGCGKKSFNSEIGVPLTVLGCDNAWRSTIGWFKVFMEGLGLIFLKNHYPNMLVVEVGTDRPGDIQKITSWLKPDVVVVTSFPEVPVHIEFFDSREALLKEKTYLVSALKEGGLLVLNADDEDVRALRQRFTYRTLTFGIEEPADMGLKDQHIEYKNNHPTGMFGRVSYGENVLPLHITGVLGVHLFYSVLAALAVGIGTGVNLVKALEALERFNLPRGRLNILDGTNTSTILDDSYNSSPASAGAALDTLAAVETQGRKIAVLGDMLELGKYSADEHRKIGARVAEKCDILVTVGIRSEFIARGAHKKKMKKRDMFHFQTADKAGEFLKDFIEPNDVVLVKGSQSIRMEKAVEYILKEPSKKKNLLVRQEDFWQRQ